MNMPNSRDGGNDEIPLEEGLINTETAVANMVRAGVISEVDFENRKIKVAVDGTTTPWIKWLSGDGGVKYSYTAPEVGEQVLVLCEAGNTSLSYAIRGLSSNARPLPSNKENVDKTVYADGSFIEVDLEEKTIKLESNSENELTLKVGGSQISLTNTQIEFSVGGSTFTMTDEGITMNGATINLN
jgi:phage baseplate assembly protein V